MGTHDSTKRSVEVLNDGKCQRQKVTSFADLEATARKDVGMLGE